MKKTICITLIIQSQDAISPTCAIALEVPKVQSHITLAEEILHSSRIADSRLTLKERGGSRPSSLPGRFRIFF
jgi:hypothetical protein